MIFFYFYSPMKLFVSAIEKNRYYFYAYFVFLFLLTGLLLILGRDELFLLINRHHGACMDLLMSYITKLGEEWSIVILLIIMVFISKRYFFASTLAYIISTIITQSLKYFIPIENLRPARYFSDKAQLNLVDGVELNHLHSFPSGHTATAFLVCTLCVLIIKSQKAGILFLLIAVLVGFSRMYLNQHFPEDVLGGSLIGVGVAVFVNYFWIDSKSFLDRFESIDSAFLKL